MDPVLLQNLLSNALKYADAQRPKVVIGARRDGARWRVTVADNGRGVAPDDQQRIFDAFARLPDAAQAAGTGLGLSICQRVVERAGGELGLESDLGEGSRFWFALNAG